MRSVFFNLLHEAMRKERKAFLIIADMGMGLVDPIQKEFPDRYLNVGIAEQNMIGISAGLCNAGFRPFCYTISNFLVHRCFEQIRNDICLHKYPVTLVGTSTGFDNGSLGPTHHVIDDIGCLRVLPGMKIYSPASVQGIQSAFHELMCSDGPSYVRIGKGSFDFKREEKALNHFAVLRPNSNILIITHGNVLGNCLLAAEKDSRFSVFCMNKIRPFEAKELTSLFKNYSKVLVVEDQMVSSGLYSMLCQFLVDHQLTKVGLFSLAPADIYEDRIGDKSYFATKHRMIPADISLKISKILESRG